MEFDYKVFQRSVVNQNILQCESKVTSFQKDKDVEVSPDTLRKIIDFFQDLMLGIFGQVLIKKVVKKRIYCSSLLIDAKTI